MKQILIDHHLQRLADYMASDLLLEYRKDAMLSHCAMLAWLRECPDNFKDYDLYLAECAREQLDWMPEQELTDKLTQQPTTSHKGLATA